MNKYLRGLALTALLVTLAGCATMSNLGKGYSLSDSSNESIVIIGVKPDYRFGVEEGTLVADQFKWSATATPILAVYPEDGYVIAVMDRTDPDQVYALTNLAESFHHYRACGDSIETFSLEPGKVIYLGDFEFATPPVRLKHTITYNPEAAQKYIQDHYPKLAGVPFVTQHTVQRSEVGFHQNDLQWLMTTCD